MEINICVTADDNEDMKQKLDVAMFKVGKHLEAISMLKVDESFTEVPNTVVSRSA